jgi:hypothetical protein
MLLRTSFVLERPLRGALVNAFRLKYVSGDVAISSLRRMVLFTVIPVVSFSDELPRDFGNLFKGFKGFPYFY